MGLDMYLVGRKFFWANWERPDDERAEDGFKVQQVELRIGYWRKHPNLHGFIVKEFANGVDECQEIRLTADNLNRIIKAIEQKKLPHTEGFFFGQSDNSERQRKADVAVFQKALNWLRGGDPSPVKVGEPEPLGGPGSPLVAISIELERKDKTIQQVTRSVIYYASW